jgi:hypothetical protein
MFLIKAVIRIRVIEKYFALVGVRFVQTSWRVMKEHT